MRRSRGPKKNQPGSTASQSGDPARSKRLAALLHLHRGAVAHPAELWGVPIDQHAALAGLTEEDMHLLNACLVVEHELLERECLMAQHLLAYDMFGEEELCEALERDDLDRRHLAAMYGLGLLDF